VTAGESMYLGQYMKKKSHWWRPWEVVPIYTGGTRIDPRGQEMHKGMVLEYRCCLSCYRVVNR
jgi:hypothetical protein